MEEEIEIVGYGVFESTDGEVFVGYYENGFPDLIEEDNFYETELEAAYAAIEILNEHKNKKVCMLDGNMIMSPAGPCVVVKDA